MRDVRGEGRLAGVGTAHDDAHEPEGESAARGVVEGCKAGRKAAGGPMRDASSLNGLGGYHGSVHVKTPKGKNVTLYYSVNAFSEILPNGQENGISVFDKPWKNVVATLYHEMSEFRTDADVASAR